MILMKNKLKLKFIKVKIFERANFEMYFLTEQFIYFFFVLGAILKKKKFVRAFLKMSFFERALQQLAVDSDDRWLGWLMIRLTADWSGCLLG